MRNRTEQLIAQFEAVNDEVLARVAEYSDEQWQRLCANDERSVGVVAHHIADVNGAFAEIVAKLVAGELHSPKTSMDEVHQLNAQHAHTYATVGKQEVLDALRTNGAAILHQLRNLDDQQLDRVAGIFGGNELTVAQVLEWIVIGHTREHLANIQAATAA